MRLAALHLMPVQPFASMLDTQEDQMQNSLNCLMGVLVCLRNSANVKPGNLVGVNNYQLMMVQ